MVADYYGFEDVIEKCSEFIEQNLTTNSCINIWEFANDFNLYKIEGIGFLLLISSLVICYKAIMIAFAFDYILRYFTSIYNHMSFIELREERFSQIITNEWVNADDKEINEAEEKWQKQRKIKDCAVEETIIGNPIHPTHLKTDSIKNGTTTRINLDLIKKRITRRLSCAGDFQVDTEVNTQRYPREVLFAIGGWHDSSPSNHIETYGKHTTRLD